MQRTYDTTSLVTEEAAKNFFQGLCDAWVQKIMDSFYLLDDWVTGSISWQRVEVTRERRRDERMWREVIR